MQIITVPCGMLLAFLYGLVENYGVAIIVFTLIIKIVMLPLSYKQQKSMAKTQKLNPELQALQKKYKNDKEKLNKETMELYKKHGASPVAGCLPLLIQFPIMIGLYQVIMRPLTHMYSVSAEAITQIQQLVTEALTAQGVEIANNVLTSEIVLANYLREFPEILSQIGLNIPVINFDFLGLNLASVPNFRELSVLWIIPILSGVSSYLSNRFMQSMQPQTAEQQNNTMSTMNIMFPLMSVVFCFSLPAGMGLYWIISGVTDMLARFGLTLYFKRTDPDMFAKPAVADSKTEAAEAVQAIEQPASDDDTEASDDDGAADTQESQKSQPNNAPIGMRNSKNNNKKKGKN